LVAQVAADASEDIGAGGLVVMDEFAYFTLDCGVQPLPDIATRSPDRCLCNIDHWTSGLSM
jgi:hypothetical protein